MTADAFDYVATRADADELIDEFGQSVSVRKITTGGDPWAPTQTTTDYATRAAIVDYADKQIDGENIRTSDRRAIVAAGPLELLGVTDIAPPDTIVVGGAAVAIVRVKPINPAGTVVLFDCQLRY